MVCLTADVHNASPASLDQRAVGGRSELLLAEDFVRIAREHGVRLTLFISGLAVIEEPDRIRRLTAFRNDLEVGAHDFDPFAPETWGWVRTRLLRHAYGSVKKQREQIQKARQAFSSLGISVTSWSGHAYRQDRHTAGLLQRASFTHASNVRSLRALKPWRQSGVVMVPVNTTPDHENLLHRNRRPPSVFPGALTGDEWRRRVEGEIAAIASSGGVAVLRVHPVCMAAVDEFETFERLCRRLAQERNVLISELTGSAQLVAAATL